MFLPIHSLYKNNQPFMYSMSLTVNVWSTYLHLCNWGSECRWVHPTLNIQAWYKGPNVDPMALRRCELFRNTSNHPIRIKTEELDFAMCVGYVLVQGSLKEFSEICSIFIPCPQAKPRIPWYKLGFDCWMLGKNHGNSKKHISGQFMK